MSREPYNSRSHRISIEKFINDNHGNDIINKIDILWKLVFEYGKAVRRESINNFVGWHNIKNLFLNEINFGKWNDEVLQFYEYFVDRLGIIENRKKNNQIINCTDLIEDDYIIWEMHHLYLQHGLIPYQNNTATCKCLMQIAYNAGQYAVATLSDTNNEIYTQEMINFYNDKKLDSISTYIKY